MKNIGERIYKYRDMCGLSQLEFAERLDVSRQAVSKWETGTATPELEKLVKMAEIFGISLDELILGKESATTLPYTADKVEIKEAPTPPEKSLTKTVMGCFFLIVGALLSVFFMFWYPLFGIFLLVLFGLCAFFCLKQFRHAALWCCETWFVGAALYLGYGTGTHWKNVFNPLLYSPQTSIWSAVFSLAEFVILALLIVLTVRAFRDKRFDYSKGKHIALAVLCGVSLVMPFVCGRIFQYICLYLVCGGDKQQYFYFLSNMDNFLPVISLAIEFTFIGVFTACLIPTLYKIIKH